MTAASGYFPLKGPALPLRKIAAWQAVTVSDELLDDEVAYNAMVRIASAKAERMVLRRVKRHGWVRMTDPVTKIAKNTWHFLPSNTLEFAVLVEVNAVKEDWRRHPIKRLRARLHFEMVEARGLKWTDRYQRLPGFLR